ncbi:hypothetical protein A5709_15265 [Mycobacterium sp. E1386]|uniref:hypothetical protein n=1 Tax=Mycobacterium sp. E1386 TaxID=1834126 RepID=UPI0007FCD1DD|nr:hypothetical protein [Mycobacterium sp. E1386]OBI37189.1 hypothetical protein A5709_15265 [Mycobacterium sp. E1386]
MYQDWLSSFRFRWTPILTYTKRHIALLDWFEENTEPVAFVDRPGVSTLGVALVAPDLRITVKRSEMVLESGLSRLSIDKLLPAVSGIFEIFEPSSVLATEYLSTGVIAVEGADYYEQCARFGAMCSAEVFNSSDQWRITDGSAVVDLTSERMKVQLEWGIVRSDELLRRLRDPEMSRLPGRMGVDDRAKIARMTEPGDDLPAVSIYTDQAGFWRTGGSVAEVSDVFKLVTEAQQAASNVATQLAERFLSEAREEAR